MHTPIPETEAEPGPHDSSRVAPQPPVPPEMTTEIPQLDPDNPKQTEDERPLKP